MGELAGAVLSSVVFVHVGVGVMVIGGGAVQFARRSLRRFGLGALGVRGLRLSGGRRSLLCGCDRREKREQQNKAKKCSHARPYKAGIIAADSNSVGAARTSGKHNHWMQNRPGWCFLILTRSRRGLEKKPRSGPAGGEGEKSANDVGLF